VPKLSELAIWTFSTGSADLAPFERPASAARRGMEGLGFEESADKGGIAVNATHDEDTDQGLLV